MNCIQTYVQTQSLGTIIAPVNGSWIQAYAEYIGLVTPINDSWLQAICEEFGITEPLYGSWTIALANYYGISQPRGTWWCALADAAYVPPGGTPPFQWDLDTRLWEVETREWAAAGTNLLDVYSGADVAYSLRNLRTDYTEAAIRVRYSSLFEEDIFFDGNGELDTATILASAATNGGDAFVKTWYDQSGNGNNASASINSDQQLIVTSNVLNLENGKPAANSVNKPGYVVNTSLASTGSVFFTGKQLTTTTLNYIGGNSVSPAWYTESAFNGEAFLGLFTNQAFASTYGTPAAQFIANWDLNTTWNVSLNNGAYVQAERNGSGSTIGVGLERVFGRNSPGLSFSGNCQEMIVWPTTQNTNLNGISTNMNDYYSAY